MRNVDKIKGLNNQIGALIRRKAELEAENAQLRKANAEIQAASNAVMISVILEYGGKEPDGTVSIRIPKVNAVENVSAYRISAKPDGDMRIISIVPVKEAESGTDTEGN